MGLFGTLNNTILLIAYIVYLLCGLVMVFAGMWYAGSTGAVGSTGIWLLIIGLFFLVLGIIALVGWKWQNGLILLVVECVSIALYFILFIVIVAALMLGSGARDPVQRFFDDHWESTLKPNTYGAAPASYKQICTNNEFGTNPKCLTFYGTMIQAGTDCLSALEKGSESATGGYGVNCTKLTELPGADCPALKVQCDACEYQCRSMLIKHAKEKNIPACIAVLLLCLYLIAIVILHTLARQGLYTGEDDDGACCKDMGPFGWVIILVNVGLCVLGLIMIMFGGLVVNTEMNSSSTLWMIMLISGLTVFFIPAAQIFFVATVSSQQTACPPAIQ